MKPDETDRFEQAWALLTNFYPQVLLIVNQGQGADRAVRWRSTDSTWSLGACKRYCESVSTLDMWEQAKRQRTGDDS